MKKIINHIKDMFNFIIHNKLSYLTETTTMFGLGFIFMSFYEYWRNLLTFDQSSGLLIVGVGLLYPQGGVRQKFLSTLLTSLLSALAAYHDIKDVGDKKK